MDESVITGNITRVVENLCYDELQTLNRGIGHLMGRPDLETDGNPLAPEGIVTAFADALKSQKSEERVKFQILKELNQGSLSDLNGDLPGPQQAPAGAPRRARCARHDRQSRRRRAPARRRGQGRLQATGAAARSRRDGDVPADVRQRPGADAAVRAAGGRRGGPAVRNAAGRARRPSHRSPDAGPAVDRRPGGRRRRGFARLPVDRVRQRGADGAVALHPVGAAGADAVRVTSPARRSSRRRCWARASSRLQAGESGFDLGAGAVQFSGIPTGMQNVLRDLQESPLGPEGEPARVDDHRDGRDAVRLHLRDQGSARRHQGAARAAADPGAEGRDARRRVLRAQDASVPRAGQRAGRGRAGLVAGDGQRRSAVPQARRDRPPDPQRLHRQPRAVRGAARRLEAFLADEEKAAEANIATTAEEINLRDRREIAVARVARRDREADRAVPGPEFPRHLPSPALVGRARARLPAGRRGERRVGAGSGDARGPGLERAAEEDLGRPQAPGRAAALAAEADVGRPAFGAVAHRRTASSSCPTWSRRTPRR